MAQKDLIPMNRRSKEEAKEMGRRGGVKSGETRRKIKDVREALRQLMQMDFAQKDGSKRSGAELVAYALLSESTKGRNHKYMQQLLETLYGKEQKIDLTSEVRVVLFGDSQQQAGN